MSTVINLDKFNRAHAIGKKKNSIARVWLKKGEGKLAIRGFDGSLFDYFKRETLVTKSLASLQASDNIGKYDMECTLKGGGLSSQAHALMHGISKCLLMHDNNIRAIIKPLGFITRDSRIVERKKYGLAKARRGFQFSKR